MIQLWVESGRNWGNWQILVMGLNNFLKIRNVKNCLLTDVNLLEDIGQDNEQGRKGWVVGLPE